MIAAIIVTIIIILVVAHYVVEALEETYNLRIHTIAKRIWEIIVAAILFGMLMLLGKCGCSFNEEYTPNGESTLEHYEPR